MFAEEACLYIKHVVNDGTCNVIHLNQLCCTTSAFNINLSISSKQIRKHSNEKAVSGGPIQAPRKRGGVPQYGQPHALLVGGFRAARSLFPGFDEDLESAGAQRVDWLKHHHSVRPTQHTREHWYPQPPAASKEDSRGMCLQRNADWV